MLTTNDEELWNRAWSFKDHGKSLEAMHAAKNPAGFRWLHDSFGTNWRLTEMQSAIGRVLLRKLPQMLSKRRALADCLTDSFSRNPLLRITLLPAGIGHAYYKYYVFLRPERLADGWNRDRVKRGIPCFSGSCSEIYLEKAFPEHVRPGQRLRVARELADTSLMFPRRE